MTSPVRRISVSIQIQNADYVGTNVKRQDISHHLYISLAMTTVGKGAIEGVRTSKITQICPTCRGACGAHLPPRQPAGRWLHSNLASCTRDRVR